MNAIYRYYAISGITPGAKKQWALINNIDRHGLEKALGEHYDAILRTEHDMEGRPHLSINQNIIIGGKKPVDEPNVLVLL